MKRFITAFLTVLIVGVVNSQVSSSDLARIVINTHLSDELNLPDIAKRNLETVLNRITSTHGIGGSQLGGRFIITANVNILSKDVLAGPPQLISQNLLLTLFVGDATSNTVFSSLSIELKGVGTNESKSFVQAFKGVNPRDNRIVEFLEQGKAEIINYFKGECDVILKQATALADQNKFEEAISQLMLVPEVCESCHASSRELAGVVFAAKIEFDCAKGLNEANLAWTSQRDEAGALAVADILSNIVPSDDCNDEIQRLSDEIINQLAAEEREQYERELLERKQQMELEERRIEATKAIAIEYLRNQPKQVVYNRIYWN